MTPLEIIRQNKSIKETVVEKNGITLETLIQNLELGNSEDKVGIIIPGSNKVHRIKSISFVNDIECFVLVPDENNLYVSTTNNSTDKNSNILDDIE